MTCARMLLVTMFVAAAFAGCLDGLDDASDAGDTADLAFIPCEHPWPCADGSEWPADLEGPFDILDAEPLAIPGHDGDIELEAYVWQPDVPEGTEVPVVLHAQPYAGQCYIGVFCIPRGDDPGWLDNAPLRGIAEAGYAVVNLNVRGTGASGGCFEHGGPNEAKDLAHAVEWLADRSWSNGRVAMTGLSYNGMTPWIAANHDPAALKTIVPGGIVSDDYTWSFTPQGAALVDAAPFNTVYVTGLSLYPPLGAPENLPAWSEVAAEQVCPGLVDIYAAFGTDHLRNERDARFWGDRQHIAGFPDITAAALVYHGLRDNGGHGYQEDAVWNALEQAPKRMILGDWGHTTPNGTLLEDYPGGDDWFGIVVPWLDFWLKGIGDEAPRLGVVDYESRDGEWRDAAAWPPDDRSDEALHLSAGTLTSGPADESTSFVATTHPTPPLVENPASITPYCAPPEIKAAFTSGPLEDAATLAGNPFAYLQVESSRPGGIVALDLYDLGPDARCVTGELEGGTWLSGGAADLRFHQGNLGAEDFPTGKTTPVRVDLFNLAHTVEEGHRLAVVASGYGHQVKVGQPYAPTIALHGDGTVGGSHIVLPVVEGTLGGDATDMEYPPRPFVPEGGS